MSLLPVCCIVSRAGVDVRTRCGLFPLQAIARTCQLETAMSQEHQHEFRRRYGAWVVFAACLVFVASGCKSGASLSKPSSWWTLGGSKDPAQLASAPPFADGGTTDGNVAKPSSMASPYPTTTTPQGYVMNDAKVAPASAPTTARASAQQLPNYPSTDDAAPVTYGQPVPTPMMYPDTAEMAGAAAAGGAVGGIATQAGPYATVTVPNQAPTAVAPATPETVVAPSRIADSRMGSSFGDSVAPAATQSPPSPGGFAGQPAVPPAPESRYGDANPNRFGASRFGAGAAAAAPPATSVAEPPAFSNNPAAPFPAAASPAPVSPAPASADPLPSSPAGSSIPATPPRRRPDPGYRPGGTSSYRPSSSILVGGPNADPAVRAASFNAPAEPVVR